MSHEDDGLVLQTQLPDQCPDIVVPLFVGTVQLGMVGGEAVARVVDSNHADIPLRQAGGDVFEVLVRSWRSVLGYYRGTGIAIRVSILKHKNEAYYRMVSSKDLP